MARARNIKPAFFENEILAECDPEARLLYIGLWTLADREGKLEDRPKRIKAQLFPYNDYDIEDLLQQLTDREFIMRYQVEGERYIWIPKFTKHQNPHKNEAPKEYPDPPGITVPKLPYTPKEERKTATKRQHKEESTNIDDEQDPNYIPF